VRAGADRSMALNKKHKKQLEVIRKKLPQLKQQLAGEKEQMDDPEAIQRIEAEIAKMEEQRRAIEAEK
jgi:cob(I)alamin adenosyltransferase